MRKPTPNILQVKSSRYITPNILRISLGGEALASFPVDQESAYVKLIFAQGEGKRPLIRTYTVSRQRDTEIDIDFALHETEGPASVWARGARPGDEILVGGPGSKKLIHPDGDWVLLVGDMTALPAITVNLKQLPTNAQGYAVLEIASAADMQAIQCPDNVEIHWVINPEAGVDAKALLSKVEQLAWLPGHPSVWAACEFQSMRALRRYFKEVRQVPKSQLYVSSYWKLGSTEDQHKVAKQADAQQS